MFSIRSGETLPARSLASSFSKKFSAFFMLWWASSRADCSSWGRAIYFGFSCGGGGIRTRESPCGDQWISSPPRSAAPAPLRLENKLWERSCSFLGLAGIGMGVVGNLRGLVDKWGVLIIDGGLATELERRGARLDTHLWSAHLLLSDPDLILRVHKDYLRAGANIIITATYQATYEGFARAGISRGRARELFKEAVRLARAAIEEYRDECLIDEGYPLLVAGSAGPYGAYLADGSEYRGRYGRSVKELIKWHIPRVETLLEQPIDILAFETIPDIHELEAISLLLEDIKPDIATWVSMSCKSEDELADGTPVVEACDVLRGNPYITAVGVNCVHPFYAERLVSLISKCLGSESLVVCYPNKGDKWDPLRKRWVEPDQEVNLPELAIRWYEAGARLIGGCCRTTPEDIRAMSDRLRGWLEK